MVTPPAVSQRLAQIEARLHLRLIECGRGPLRLTTEGSLVVRRAGGILTEIERLAEDLAVQIGRIEGPLHVIAPFGFSRFHVAPVLARFASDYPDLRPALFLSDDPLTAMWASPWDVLIHVGRLRDQSTIQRELAPNRRFSWPRPAT